jgi:hypothetical protein
MRIGDLKRGKGERGKGKGEKIITNAQCPIGLTQKATESLDLP